MKNKITPLITGIALLGATAHADIAIADGLSAYGYIDMALTDGEATGDTSTTVAEFELGLSFAPAESKWSAVVELSLDNDSTSTTTNSIDADAVVAANNAARRKRRSYRRISNLGCCKGEPKSFDSHGSVFRIVFDVI